jgi:hypothetical protein
MNASTELIKQLRNLEEDHEPEGWPAVKMRDISSLLDLIEALQAKLDRLMFEYCPEDMTKEQVNKWGKHQVVFKG